MKQRDGALGVLAILLGLTLTLLLWLLREV